MEFAGSDGEGETPQDLPSVDGDVEVGDLEGGRTHGRHCTKSEGNNTMGVVKISRSRTRA